MSEINTGTHWNDFVDGTVGGEGGYAFFCLIHFTGWVESGSLICPLESIAEDEADGEPFISMDDVRLALRYVDQQRAMELVAEGVELLNSDADDDQLDHADALLTREFTALFEEKKIEAMLQAKLASHPDHFLVGQGNFLD